MKEYVIPKDKLNAVKRLFYGEIFNRTDEYGRTLIYCYVRQVRLIEQYLKFKPKLKE